MIPRTACAENVQKCLPRIPANPHGRWQTRTADLLGVNQGRVLRADYRWLANSRELQQQGTARPLADLSPDARLCGQRVRRTYE